MCREARLRALMLSMQHAAQQLEASVQACLPQQHPHRPLEQAPGAGDEGTRVPCIGMEHLPAGSEPPLVAQHAHLQLLDLRTTLSCLAPQLGHIAVGPLVVRPLAEALWLGWDLLVQGWPTRLLRSLLAACLSLDPALDPLDPAHCMSGHIALASCCMACLDAVELVARQQLVPEGPGGSASDDDGKQAVAVLMQQVKQAVAAVRDSWGPGHDYHLQARITHARLVLDISREAGCAVAEDLCRGALVELASRPLQPGGSSGGVEGGRGPAYLRALSQVRLL